MVFCACLMPTEQNHEESLVEEPESMDYETETNDNMASTSAR